MSHFPLPPQSEFSKMLCCNSDTDLYSTWDMQQKSVVVTLRNNFGCLEALVFNCWGN